MNLMDKADRARWTEWDYAGGLDWMRQIGPGSVDWVRLARFG